MGGPRREFRDQRSEFRVQSVRMSEFRVTIILHVIPEINAWGGIIRNPELRTVTARAARAINREGREVTQRKSQFMWKGRSR